MTRESGFMPVVSMPCWGSIEMLPKLTTISARPFVSWSRVAAICAMWAGSRRMTWVTLGPIRIRVVLSAAAANRSHMSFHQVSSTE